MLNYGLSIILSISPVYLQDSMRFLIQDSLANFTQMVVDACYSTVEVKEDFVWGGDIINSPFKYIM